ncbi:hypothetical protein FJZ53_00415 [Candidatus Woesearchaeota archaeon]|nr:hypothetical protein [Candidatus Woesearchaeota archaeon]
MALLDQKKMKEGVLELLGEEKEEEEEELPKEKQDLPAENRVRSQKVIMQQMQAAGEAYYFWITNFLRNPNALGYDIDKVSDVYTATEASSYFGNIEARKEAQMRNVSQNLATIGQLTKNLFQMIRELRIIDERKDYYEKSNQGDESAEVALKGIWTSMVEGGAENPTSVMGLARKVGFVIVPDLFFQMNPKNGSKGVDKEVNALSDQGINPRVRSVVKQKLMQYYLWKERTGKELDWRKTFVLKSFAQTYHSIRMYTRWLKPYLRNIRKLQMSGAESPDLVTAFETSAIDLELFCVKPTYEVETPMGFVEKKYANNFPCIRVKFNYITRPEMTFQQEYQRGATHAGRTTIVIEGFVLSKSEMEAYKQKKEDEDLEIINSVEMSVESLGDELKKYLEEAGEKLGKDKTGKAKKPQGMAAGMLEPFVSVFKGFGEIFGGMVPKGKGEPEKKMTPFEIEQEKDAAKSVVKANVFTLYDVFKKAHGLMSW